MNVDNKYDYITIPFYDNWQSLCYSESNSIQDAYIIWLYDKWNHGLISLDEFRGAIQINV